MRTIRMMLVFALLIEASLPIVGKAAEESVVESPAQRNARMAWLREGHFGMFIHWGIYSVPAGTWRGRSIPGIGEWIMLTGKIPVADYAKLTEQFNPVKFDAEQWVLLAKNAGMKYIVITSKHHDGFAMFHSQASSYNIFDATPFKRDPLKELADACQKHDMKLGFYYSQCQDWHHPGGAAHGGHWDKAQDGDFNQYLEKIVIPQVRELLTSYGPVAVFWWDFPTADLTAEHARKLHDLLKLQPGIISNNRLGGGWPGDTDTPEQSIPATGTPGRDWETCMTMNDTWGFKADDNNWKTSETLIRNLVEITSKGGNYLLNVGPTSLGEIPSASVDRLKSIGKWMAVNGESIHGTTASPFDKPAWGRYTKKTRSGGITLYAHVFDWPKNGKLLVPSLDGEVTGARLLSGGQAIVVKHAQNGLTLALPDHAPDPIDTVIAIYTRK